MVEGPGCTLHGDNIRSRVQKGQKVQDITGDAKAIPSADGSNAVSFRVFGGCQYVGVDTLGKELFLYFGLRALRVHFGMNGSLRINPSDRKDRTGRLPALQISLTNDLLCFFDTTVEIRLADECEQKVRTMESLDVCSPKFSSSRAMEVLASQSNRMLCDVLLDQTVLPGVGNIIKNEALFNSGLHPASKVSQLTDGEIRHLVKMTRDFSLLFYKCNKSGSLLHKHYKVYKQPRCGQCMSKITVCRLGENGRMTYFCHNCQNGAPSQVNVSKLQCRNSLMGWVSKEGPECSDHVAPKNEQWTCELCTLKNGASAESCAACLSPRPQLPKKGPKEDFSFSTRHVMKCPHNAFAKPREELKVNREAAFGTSTLIFTDCTKREPLTSPTHSFGKTHLSSLANSNINKQSFGQGKVSPRCSPGSSCKRSSEECMVSSQPCKKMRIDHKSSSSNKPQCGNHNFTSFNPQVTPTDFPSSPCCIAHRRPCALRVVRKDGKNKGRQFYGCALPQEARCHYFEWADLHFPTCKHGKRCLLRTVLKLGANNGRRFYVCPLGTASQCDFFQWVK
ncbi:endonuclease 8-like 3 isoform X1 [Brienomyrus brachyistius]|uniref:endonuclease 8-like 3 isoform X1 n=1 Tax=Brienomyrus brachyistius TaxID=42636 RepID=UPI0020B25BBB|nr:endonuclease 8-like 3 isoform X1 [Brienomyrus brachyistius]